MHKDMARQQSVIVILDPLYGASLRELPAGIPVWVVLSPVNEPVVRELWAARSDESHLTGITGMVFEPDANAAEVFVDKISTIDLHHGPHSTTSPYTLIEVIGISLSDLVQKTLAEFGFTEFSVTSRGFVARRSSEVPGQ